MEMLRLANERETFLFGDGVVSPDVWWGGPVYLSVRPADFSFLDGDGHWWPCHELLMEMVSAVTYRHLSVLCVLVDYCIAQPLWICFWRWLNLNVLMVQTWCEVCSLQPFPVYPVEFLGWVVMICPELFRVKWRASLLASIPFVFMENIWNATMTEDSLLWFCVPISTYV